MFYSIKCIRLPFCPLVILRVLTSLNLLRHWSLTVIQNIEYDVRLCANECGAKKHWVSTWVFFLSFEFLKNSKKKSELKAQNFENELCDQTQKTQTQTPKLFFELFLKNSKRQTRNSPPPKKNLIFANDTKTKNLSTRLDKLMPTWLRSNRKRIDTNWQVNANLAAIKLKTYRHELPS